MEYFVFIENTCMCYQQHRGRCHQGDKISQVAPVFSYQIFQYYGKNKLRPQEEEFEQCHLEWGQWVAAAVLAFEVGLQGFPAVVLQALVVCKKLHQ